MSSFTDRLNGGVILYSNLQPTASYWGQAIDCRHLQMNFEFYELSRAATLSLTEELANWVREFLSDTFISIWKHNGRTIRSGNLVSKVRSTLENSTMASWSIDAHAHSNVVFNVESLRRYSLRIHQSTISQIGTSIDFFPYWSMLFPDGRCENDELCRRILQLFSMKNKHSTSLHTFPDMQVYMCMAPHSHNKEVYYGTASVSVSSFCINAQLREVAQLFFDKLYSVSIRYKHINGRVMLQPPTLPIGSSPYMSYFGQNCGGDGSYNYSGQKANEWYRTYYICGIEWANIISPRAKVHIGGITRDSKEFDHIECQEIENGSIMLGSKKPIDTFDVDDAALLKKLVHRGLYPGCTQFPLRDLFPTGAVRNSFTAYPRRDWAVVPVLENEVSIIGSTLVIRSGNYCFNG